MVSAPASAHGLSLPALRLYLVTDQASVGARTLADVVAAAVQGGVTCVQLREKHLCTRDFFAQAMVLKALLAPRNIPLVINDRIDVALACGAQGVHLGQSDMPVAQARRLLPPRMFIAEDVDHTHSAKAGQEINVSMQDGFNLGRKLAHALLGYSSESLLATYSAQRKAIGEDIIRFDQRWAVVVAKSPEEFDGPSDFEEAYLQITEFAQGFMTQYAPSMIVAESDSQILVTGFPISKRFEPAVATQVADANVIHIGHESRVDGLWRLLVFVDSAHTGEASPTAALAEWLAHSPVRAATPSTAEANGWFDIKLIYQQAHTCVALSRVPATYIPRVGRFELVDCDGIFDSTPGDDIFKQRGIDRGGAIVVVRPDQYVANVLMLTTMGELPKFAQRSTARAVMTILPALTGQRLPKPPSLHPSTRQSGFLR